jgi:hypothetical protein
MKDWFGAGTRDRKIKPVLRQLAKSFARAHDEYIRFNRAEDGILTDIGWFHNERANIGFLAGAAWRLKGWVALEEFPVMKRRRGKRAGGRADLFIGARRSNGDAVGMFVESKHVFSTSAKRIKHELNARACKSKIRAAMRDARTIQEDGESYRIAAVFVCPALITRRSTKESFETIGRAFQTACKQLSRDGYEWAAFSYTSPATEHQWKERKWSYAYPAVGVVFVGV